MKTKIINGKPLPEWLTTTGHYERRGIAEGILRLLVAEAITVRKAVELLEHMRYSEYNAMEDAPWGELDWAS